MKKPINTDQLYELATQQLDLALKSLRAIHKEIDRPTKDGADHLMEGIRWIETGCMWVNKSRFPGEYSPVIKKND